MIHMLRANEEMNSHETNNIYDIKAAPPVTLCVGRAAAAAAGHWTLTLM